jgi:hypothetical protein
MSMKTRRSEKRLPHNLAARPRRRSTVAAGCWMMYLMVAPLAAAQPAAEELKTVKLSVDYGDGVQKHFLSITWQRGMTVLDVMRAADRHPRGIGFQYRGKRATALLTAIDDVQNEGGRGRNWIYRVNGKLADRSFAIYELQSGDKVLWKFDVYR